MKYNKKIVQLTSDYIPKPLWGMGWHVVFLVQELKRRKYCVYVATAHKSKNAHKNIITTSKTEDRFGLSNKNYEIFNNFNKFNKWQLSLAQKIIDQNIEFKIIHCHNWMSWLTAKKLKEDNHNIKIIVTFHFLQKQYELMNENPISCYHKEIIKIEEDILKKADKIIVVSKRHYDLLLKEYGALKFKQKIKIINNGVDFGGIEYKDIEKNRKINLFLDVIFVGRLEKDKGIIQTIEVFNKITKENKKVRLHIVGIGSLFDGLKKQHNSKQIIFHGFVNRNVLKKLLIKSSIFCMPSSSEAFPTTVIEAMIFGVVPVFSKGKMVPNLFDDGVCGVKVSLYSSQEGYNVLTENLYSTINKLIKNPKMIEKMSKKSYDYANKNLTSRHMADNIIKIYNKL